MASVQRFTHTYTVLFGEAGTSDVAFLSYDPVLARVRIDQSVLATVNGSPPPAGATRIIERSTDLAHWTVVRGGSEADVDAGAGMVDDYEFSTLGTNYYRIRVLVAEAAYWTLRDQIIAAVTTSWLKFPRFPFLNRPVVVTDFGTITRPSRAGVFQVVGRSLPVAVTDVRGSRQFDLELYTETLTAGDELETVLSAGDVVLLQTPGGCPVPGGYFAIGDLTVARTAARSERRYFTLPVTQVAGPDASLSAATITWRGLANRYATWGDVIAANATWGDVLELRGTPADLVTS